MKCDVTKPKTWRTVVWYGWVVGAALLAVNVSLAYLLGFDGLPTFWDV